MKLILSIALLLTSFGGRVVVSGKVISFEESFPVEGVTVSVKGKNNVTGTMFDGSWCLELKEGDSVLVFSHEEYEPLELKIQPGKMDYNTVLHLKGY